MEIGNAFLMALIAIFCKIMWSCFWYFGLLLQDPHQRKILNPLPNQASQEGSMWPHWRPYLNLILMVPDPKNWTSPHFPLTNNWINNQSKNDGIYHIPLGTPVTQKPPWNGQNMRRHCTTQKRKSNLLLQLNQRNIQKSIILWFFSIP